MNKIHLSDHKEALRRLTEIKIIGENASEDMNHFYFILCHQNMALIGYGMANLLQ